MGSRRVNILQDGEKKLNQQVEDNACSIGGVARKMPSFSLLPTDVGSVVGRGVECAGDLQHGCGILSRVARTDGEVMHPGEGVGKLQHSVFDGFRNVDPAFEEEVLNLADNSTKQKNNWARKKFDAWRHMCGLDSSVPLEKLGLHELNDSLSKFFLVVCKKGGGLFPSDTLMGMLRCFGRMLKKEQELRIASSGVAEVPFDIARNPIFKSTQNAVLAAMRKSVAQGVCKDRKKSSIIGVSLEQAILSDVDFSITHARGCQMRFAFFCMLHFCVRGGLELYKLQRSMFSTGSDELGRYVRFCERSSKNYKVDFNHFQPEHFRPLVTARDSDVLATYEQLIRHMPVVIEGDKNLIYIFLQPINNARTQVWYNRNRVSMKALNGIVKNIAERSGVVGMFSNKSVRNTSVTRMSLGQVPRKVGMLVTGHKRLTSYDKYDLSNEVRMAAAQEILSQPYDEFGKLKAYPQVLKRKFSNFSENIEGNVHGAGNADCSGEKNENAPLGASIKDKTVGAGVHGVGFNGSAVVSGNVGVVGSGNCLDNADRVVEGSVKHTSNSHPPKILP